MLKQKKIRGMYFEVFAIIELRKDIQFCRNCKGQRATMDHKKSGDLTKNERIIDPRLRPHKQINSNQEGK